MIGRSESARQAVREDRLVDAQQNYDEIKQIVDEAVKDGALGADERLKAIRNDLVALGESLRRIATVAPVITTSRWLRLLAWLSGIHLSADVRYWFVRPMLSLTLLVLLVLWGMQALYVNGSTKHLVRLECMIIWRCSCGV